MALDLRGFSDAHPHVGGGAPIVAGAPVLVLGLRDSASTECSGMGAGDTVGALVSTTKEGCAWFLLSRCCFESSIGLEDFRSELRP